MRWQMGSDASAPSEAERVAREAARQLIPVVVEFGPVHPALRAFAAGVEHTDRPYLLLDPIAASRLPPSSEHLVHVAPEDLRLRWSLWAPHIEARSESIAAVSLRDARVVAREPLFDDMPSNCREMVVLVVPGGLPEHDTYVFPVVSIGRGRCEVWTRVPLHSGMHLPHVDIVGDTRVLRRATADVGRVRPWYTPEGEPTFRCELALSPLEAPAERKLYDLVTEPLEVKRLLRQAGLMNAVGHYEAPGWGRGSMRFLRVDQASAALSLDTPPQADALPASAIRLAVEVFAQEYELEVRPLQRREVELEVALPLFLRLRRRSRRDRRVPVPPSNIVRVHFRNPATGKLHECTVIELSFFAIVFELGPSEAGLWEELPLEQATLHWDDPPIALGTLRVDALGQHGERPSCTAAVLDPTVATDQGLIRMIASFAHPYVSTHDGTNFETLLQTYRRARLFGPHMDRNLNPILAQTSRVWHALHRDAADVVRTLIHGPADAPDGAVTVMRAWEHAWVAQHFVGVSSEINGATGKLQLAYLDHLLPRPDGRYVLFFIKDDNSRMNAYVERFLSTTGTPEAVHRTRVELWSHRIRDGLSSPTTMANLLPPSAAEDDEVSLRAMTEADEGLVSRAAERCLGVHGASALSFRPGEMGLPDTHARLSAAGLLRARPGFIVEQAGTPRFALLEEQSTPGMNLTWMLNATWVLPLSSAAQYDPRLPRVSDAAVPPRDAALQAALRFVLAREAQTPTCERFLNLPSGFDARELTAAGFAREAGVFLYVLNRAGLHRFFHYAAVRYGEIDALTKRRARRRVAAPSGNAG